jgi:hypothetical protein
VYVNTYRWDFATVAALCAPRPLLLGNSDADAIFPVPGYRRLADKVKRIYKLYGAEEKFALLETSGPHKDTPELRLGAYRWMNRWLKGDNNPVKEREIPKFEPKQLKVFAKVPDDAVNAIIHETFIKSAHPQLPKAPAVVKEWWPAKRKEWLQTLSQKVFHGWPEKAPPLKSREAADVKHDGLRLRAFDFVSEEGVELRLWLLTAAKVEKPKLVVLTAVDETGWQEWLRDLGPEFKTALQEKGAIKLDAAKFAQNRKVLEFHQWAFATIAPRGIGPTRWSPSPLLSEGGRKDEGDTHIRRRFPLIGQTLDGQRVWDVRRGLAVLRGVADLKGVPLWLQGKDDMAGIVLYAALFEPDVARLDLWHLPSSHVKGPIFLNVRRTLDLPQALALAFPCPIRLYVRKASEAENWAWPLQLQKSLGQDYLKIRTVGDEP